MHTAMKDIYYKHNMTLVPHLYVKQQSQVWISQCIPHGGNEQTGIYEQNDKTTKILFFYPKLAM